MNRKGTGGGPGKGDGPGSPSTGDILALNRKAWDAIGERTASPYLGCPGYLRLFERFCASIQHLPHRARVLDLGCGPGVPVTRELIRKGFTVMSEAYSTEHALTVLMGR